MTVQLIKDNLNFLKEKNIDYKITIENQEYKNNKKEKEIIKIVYNGDRKIEVIFYELIDPLYLLSLDKIFKEYCNIKTRNENLLMDFLSKLEPNISLKDSIINVLEIFKNTFDLDNTDFFINEKSEIIKDNIFKKNDDVDFFENIICIKNKIYLPIKIEENFLGYFLLYKKSGFDLYEYYLVNKLNDYIRKNIESSFLENKFNIILDKSLNVLTKILEARVPGAEKHCENVYNYSIKIAKKMNLSNKNIDNLKYGSLIFDIGKIGIPENILSKKEKLTEEENERVKKHVNNGYELLSKIPTIPEDVKKIV
ncbi:MAG: HD-GYP domain-containing protein, partial [Thermotogota bacterium]